MFNSYGRHQSQVRGKRRPGPEISLKFCNLRDFSKKVFFVFTCGEAEQVLQSSDFLLSSILMNEFSGCS